MRLFGYQMGIFRSRRLPAFVLSIGNLTAGGTGKTPAVEMIARWALKQGYRPAIVSRGYGGRFRGEVLVVSDGKKVKSDPITSGDEPYFLAQRLSHTPVIISSARYAGGLLACEELGSDFLILDDGFQHMELERDLDIILLDGTNPFGNNYLLPRGPLREPIGSLKRANALILTRCGPGKTGKRTQKDLSGKFPGIPVFLSNHVSSRVVFPGKDGDRIIPVTKLKGKRAVAFAGIARPGSFRKSLEDLGVEILTFERFRDHHIYTPREINALLARKEHLRAEYILTTGKDWVKVAETDVMSRELGYVDIQFKLVNGEETFFSLVRDAYEKKQGAE